jgi:hypothetical protein
MAANIDVTLKRFNGTDNDTLHPTTTWTQVENKPSTFTPTSHTHGNITDGGQITATQVAPTSGDFILISDTDNGGKIERGIAIGTSTTTFLRNDGTFATPAGGGNISGPGSSTPGNVPQWNGTTGTLLQAGLGISNSTSASALTINPNLVTEQDVYYGTPRINDSKSYTSSTNIYAPSTGGTAGQMLVSAGSTTTPTWADITDETEWEQLGSVYQVYSSAGTTLTLVSGQSPVSPTDYEYKVVFVAATTNEDNDGITIQLNGVTSNYSWVYTRTQITGADAITETNLADSAGATYIDTGTFLNSYSSGGTGFITFTRIEFTINLWDVVSSTFSHISIQGEGSAHHTGASGSSSGSALTQFGGVLHGQTQTTISSIVITHNINAGGTDEAAARLYRRKKGF